MSIDEQNESYDVDTSLESELAVPFKSEMSPVEIEKLVAIRGSKLEGAFSLPVLAYINLFYSGSVGKIHRKDIQEEIDEIVRLFPNIPKAHYLRCVILFQFTLIY